jgi:outer membrane protein assembly factor BamB
MGRGRSMVAGVSFAATLLAPTAAAGAPSDAALQVRPGVGPPTSAVGVHGTGFTPAETVDLAFDRDQVGSAVADGAGAFSAEIVVPASALPGGHHVGARGESSLLSARARFIVRSDWRSFCFDQARTCDNPYENVIGASNACRLTRVWTGTVCCEAVIAGRALYTSSWQPYQGSYAYAIDRDTGQLLWSSTLVPPGPDYGGAGIPVAGGRAVYVPSGTALDALDPETGSILWTANGVTESGDSPVEVGDVVIVSAGNPDFILSALDVRTGGVRWSVGQGAGVEAVAGGVLYTGFSNPDYGGTLLTARDPETGSVLWQRGVSYSGGGVTQILDGLIVLADPFTGTRAFRLTDGAPVWQHRNIMAWRVIPMGGTLYATPTGGGGAPSSPVWFLRAAAYTRCGYPWIDGSVLRRRTFDVGPAGLRSGGRRTAHREPRVRPPHGDRPPSRHRAHVRDLDLAHVGGRPYLARGPAAHGARAALSASRGRGEDG